ncbi:MAG TPA: heme-binding protein [Pseudolabrys sp.]|nr:heme-binding protein [Pseudolabrys sp.]
MSGIMKFITAVAVTALAAVLALSLPAQAQGVLTQKNVSLSMAQAIANAAIEKCQSMGYKVAAAVVERGGQTIVMLRGDGAGLHTPEGAERKAYTARTFSQPSADFVKRLSDRPDTVGSRQYTRVLALGGGLPIKAGNEVIGAVGVSGSPGKDDECSQAGLDKVADQLK